MFSLLSDTAMRTRLWTELPALLAALTVAELFYKFHSFLLETAAFLATWHVLGLGMDWLRRRRAARPAS
jgi:hypothetical protein